MLRRHDELTRIEQSDIGLRRVKIDDSADQSGDQGGPPVSTDKKRLPQVGVLRFGHMGHNKVNRL